MPYGKKALCKASSPIVDLRLNFNSPMACSYLSASARDRSNCVHHITAQHFGGHWLIGCSPGHFTAIAVFLFAPFIAWLLYHAVFCKAEVELQLFR